MIYRRVLNFELHVDARTKEGKDLVQAFGSKEDAKKALWDMYIKHNERYCARIYSREIMFKTWVDWAKHIKDNFGGTSPYSKRVMRSFHEDFWLCSPEYGFSDYNKSTFKECRSDKAMKAWNAWLEKQ